MYGLPSDFDGAFLIGKTLNQISFNEYQVAFHFDAGTWITVESEFGYDAGVGEMSRTRIPVTESNVMPLLGRSISRVEGTRDGTLALTFDNAHRLFFFDQPHYEAYQIEVPGRLIIV